MAIPTQDFFTAIKTFIEEAVKEEVTRQMQTAVQAKEEMDTIKIQEVERITGYKKGSIYEMAHKGTIPCFRVRRSLRFSRKDITKWLEEGKRKPYNKSKD